MTKSFWALVLTIVAFSLPIVCAFVISGNPQVFWGYVAMVLAIVFQAMEDSEDGGRIRLISAATTLVSGIILVLFFSLLSIGDPLVVIMLSGMMFAASIFVSVTNRIRPI